MKKLCVTVFCFSVAAVAAVGASAGDEKTVKIDGSWVATEAFAKGKKFPAEILEKANVIMRFKDGSYAVMVQGKEVETGTYKMNATKKPATIDMVVKTGKDKGKTQLGIYKLDGDSLTVAIGQAGTDSRPKTFNFAEAGDAEITTLKRQK